MTTRRGQMRELRPAAPAEAFRYRITRDGDSLTFTLESAASEAEPAVSLTVAAHGSGEGLCRTGSGRAYAFAWAWVGPELHLWLAGDLFVFQPTEARRRDSVAAREGAGDVLAPMPGAVLEVLVGAGDQVERNQTVIIMESMKMELVITAPRDGTVRRVAVQPGQQVERGMRLLELTPM